MAMIDGEWKQLELSQVEGVEKKGIHVFKAGDEINLYGVNFRIRNIGRKSMVLEPVNENIRLGKE